MQRRIFASTFILILVVLAGVFVETAFAQDIITLEEAKKLAQESRSLKQSQLSVERAKYEYYQAKENYNEAKTPSYYNLLPYYSYLNERQEQGEDVSVQLASVEKQISVAKEKLDAESEKASALKDTMENKEIAYDDSVAAKEKSEKQLDYQVAQMYTGILLQEEKNYSMSKELEYKYSLLNIERKRLALGYSTKEKVDTLAIETSNFNKTLIEANNTLKNLRGKFNDFLGREYEQDFKLVPFSVNEVIAIPVYSELLPVVTQNYDKLAQLTKSIKNRKGDLNNSSVKDTAYESELINIEIKKQELELEDEKNKLKETINNLITDLNLKQKNYQLGKIEWENAQKNYERAKKRFDLGLISKLDLLQGELKYVTGRNKYMSESYDLFLAKQSLELARAGIL